MSHKVRAPVAALPRNTRKSNPKSNVTRTSAIAKGRAAISKGESSKVDVAIADRLRTLSEEPCGLLGLTLPREVAAPKLVRSLSPRSQEVLEDVSLLNGWVAPPADVVILVLRLSVGLSEGLISKQQREQVQQQLENGQVDTVRDLLDGLGVVLGPDMPIEAPWICKICFTDNDVQGWCCPVGHRYCTECMRQHIDSTNFPRCPTPKCTYHLADSDLRRVGVAPSRLEAFAQAQLHRAIEVLSNAPAEVRDRPEIEVRQGSPSLGDAVIRCPDAFCGNVILVPRGARRFCQVCPCGAPPFCTRCRETPYHFHGDCWRVQILRQQWLTWISAARAQYLGSDEQSRIDDSRVKDLVDRISRRRQLEEDERWKQQHCRVCPDCQLPIQKTQGCDTMACGQDFHGGNVQPGCGRRFKWSEAVPYEPVIPNDRLDDLATEPVTSCRGRDSLHVFINCSVCGSHGAGIVGPRFRCVHCHDFSVCLACEPQLMVQHPPDHVFEIMYETDFAWEWLRLPVGTSVRTVRQGDSRPWAVSDGAAPTLLPDGLIGIVISVTDAGTGIHRLRRGFWVYKVRCDGLRLQLSSATVDLEISAAHLEPVLKSNQEAEICIQQALQEASVAKHAKKKNWIENSKARPNPKQSDRLNAWRAVLFGSDSEDD